MVFSYAKCEINFVYELNSPKTTLDVEVMAL